MGNKILVIEDDAAIAEAVKLNLECADYSVTTFDNGLTAWNMLQQNHDYDLALLDMMLPGMDGFTLLPKIQECGIPVICLTAMGDAQHEVQGLRGGAEDYIAKPFDMLALMVRMEKVLKRSGKPISEDELLVGYNGEIGGLSGNYLNFNQYGRAYLIPGKTTPTQLAFTYYFRADMRTGTNLLVSFPDFEESIELQALREQMEKDLTPNDAVQKLRSLWGDALVEETFADHMDDLSAGAYHFLALRAYEQAHSDEMVCISLPNSSSLPFKTFGQGDVYVNSLCVRIRTSHYTEPGGSNEKVIFHMTDGTDFVVVDNITDNTLFKRVIENDDTLYMLGSAINIDNIQSVEVIGNLGGATLEADTE